MSTRCVLCQLELRFRGCLLAYAHVPIINTFANNSVTGNLHYYCQYPIDFMSCYLKQGFTWSSRFAQPYICQRIQRIIPVSSSIQPPRFSLQAQSSQRPACHRHTRDYFMTQHTRDLALRNRLQAVTASLRAIYLQYGCRRPCRCCDVLLSNVSAPQQRTGKRWGSP